MAMSDPGYESEATKVMETFPSPAALNHRRWNPASACSKSLPG
jgi:hypothetical protein